MLNSNKVPTIRQLQLFSTLVETGSISKVAEQLHISQPSVSIQLRKMAELLGVELYTLVGKQLVITEPGKAVYQASQQIAANYENLKVELNAFSGLQAGTLRLCVVSTAQYFMPKLLGAFCRRFPQIDVQLTINNRQKVFNRLKQNRDDFYLLSHCPDDLDIVQQPFLDNALVVVAQKKHELIRQPHISLNRIQHYPFIMREPGSGTRETIDAFCKQQGIKLKERMTIESNEAIKHMVAEGIGLAILSRHTLDYNPLDGVVKLDVDQFPILSDWYLVHSKQRQLSLLARTFEQFMQTEGRELLQAYNES